jgi:hypothetical protein
MLESAAKWSALKNLAIHFEEWTRMRENQHEMKTLTEIGVALLTRLLSGEIRLKEAEESIGALV